MASATGAPPPPPPPPPPHHSSPFDNLPAELLLILYEQLDLYDFINFALATYPTLMRHTMAPELSPQSLVRIKRGHRVLGGAVSKMPSELWLQIAGYLEPANSIALVFALGWALVNNPSDELVMRLRTWSRRRKDCKDK